MFKNTKKKPPEWVLRLIDEDLIYYPEKGGFKWKIRNNHTVLGYIGKFNTATKVLEHPLNNYSNSDHTIHHLVVKDAVWYKETGKWPKFPLKHIDGDNTNCRFNNLELMENFGKTIRYTINKNGSVHARCVLTNNEGKRIDIGVGTYASMEEAKQKAPAKRLAQVMLLKRQSKESIIIL